MSRRSDETQYGRLARDLVAAIEAGVYAVGERLPTEAEICAERGLSRGTVRQAMRFLEEQGLIARRPRAGTIVVAQRPLARYAPLAANTADIVDFARYTEVLRPEMGDVLADEALARWAGVEVGSAWFRIRGLRSMKGDAEPRCWSEQYLRADLPSRTVLAEGSFDVASISHHRVEQEVRAENATEPAASALGIAPGAAVLVVVRRHIDTERGLLSVSLHTHPGDRFTISSVLLPVTGGTA